MKPWLKYMLIGLFVIFAVGTTILLGMPTATRCPECEGSNTDIEPFREFCKQSCLAVKMTPKKLIVEEDDSAMIVMTHYDKSVRKSNVNVPGYYVRCSMFNKGDVSTNFSKVFEEAIEWQEDEICLLPQVITKYDVMR